MAASSVSPVKLWAVPLKSGTSWKPRRPTRLVPPCRGFKVHTRYVGLYAKTPVCKSCGTLPLESGSATLDSQSTPQMVKFLCERNCGRVRLRGLRRKLHSGYNSIGSTSGVCVTLYLRMYSTCFQIQLIRTYSTCFLIHLIMFDYAINPHNQANTASD